MKLPDDKLKWNEERKHYDFGEINWDEFWNVVKGNGPCNKQRLDARKKAWEEGEWVREAAAAYAEKRKSKHTKSCLINNEALKINNEQLFIRKFYYGDIPEDKAGGNISFKSEAKSDWPLMGSFYPEQTRSRS